MRRNVYSSDVSQGVDLFALKFTCTGLSPSTILGITKPECDGRTDRQTDGRTDGFAVA